MATRAEKDLWAWQSAQHQAREGYSDSPNPQQVYHQIRYKYDHVPGDCCPCCGHRHFSGERCR